MFNCGSAVYYYPHSNKSPQCLACNSSRSVRQRIRKNCLVDRMYSFGAVVSQMSRLDNINLSDSGRIELTFTTGNEWGRHSPVAQPFHLPPKTRYLCVQGIIAVSSTCVPVHKMSKVQFQGMHFHCTQSTPMNYISIRGITSMPAMGGLSPCGKLHIGCL